MHKLRECIIFALLIVSIIVAYLGDTATTILAMTWAIFFKIEDKDIVKENNNMVDIEKCRKIIYEACEGRWTMNIPQDKNNDSDLILINAIDELEKYQSKSSKMIKPRNNQKVQHVPRTSAPPPPPPPKQY